MKKIKIFLMALFVLAGSLFAEENLFSVSIGLCSGVPFYGSKNITQTIDSFENKNSRAVIGALGSLNFNVVEPVTFFGGVDFVSDFNWTSEKRCNVLSLDFNTGMKIYPGIGGFNIGIAYVLGYRSDYTGPKPGKSARNPSPWGNGYKLSFEYNFAHEGERRFLPSAGLFWKRMPRGEHSFDNQLTAYACINL